MPLPWDMVSLILGIFATTGVLGIHDWRIPRFVRDPPHLVEFYNTQGAEVPCSAEGRPAPVIGWVKRGGSAVHEKTGLRHVRPDGTLVFTSFRPDEYRQEVHSATYRCTAVNAIGIVGSHEVYVRAVVTQQFDVRVYDEFVTQGNIAVMKCHIPSFVKDFVSVTSWYRDDGLVLHSDESEGGKHYVLPSGELHINNVQQQDGFHGYQCQVKLRLSGETKQSLSSGQLIVTERHSNIPPRLVHRVSEVRGRVGEEVVIPCVSQGNPPPTYSWTRVRNGLFQPLAVGLRVRVVEGTLRIRQALEEDSGKYVCTSNNSVGKDSFETSLLISAPLKVTVTPSVRKVQLGQSVAFNCTVSGWPVDSVTWVKNLMPLASSDRVRFTSSTLLSIKSIQRSDKGVYQCLVRDGSTLDSAQGSAALMLGDDPPLLESTFAESIRHPGTSLSLKCSASGSPLPQVTWKLDGLPLPEILRFRVGDYVTMDSRVVSYVNITNVRPEDGGVYSCSASNEVGSVTHSSRINVIGPPVVRHMANVTALAGTVLRVQCPVGGYPVTAIAWERGGRQLPQNHRQTVDSNGTLTVREVNRKSDGGKYTCSVQNSQGERGAGDMHLHVLVAPKIEPFQFPADPEEGMRSVVVCAVLAGDPPLDITWLKDGRMLTSDLDARVELVNEFTSSLTFSSVGPKHSGSYTCVAKNPAATVNYTTEMIVKVSPFWVKEPSDGSAIVGGSLTIDCQADGNPAPQIRWKTSTGSPGIFRTVISNPQIQILENGSLVFREVEQSDQGDYMCQAINGVSPGLSDVIRISVHVPAHFKSKFQSLTRRVGEQLILQCAAYGEKPLTLTWTRDKLNIDIRSENRYSEEQTVSDNGTLAKLVIQSVSRQDSALFTCHVTNVFGSDERNVQVIVLETPDGPGNLQAKDTTTRTAVLAWNPPFNGNSPLTKYLLQYKLATAEEWQEREAETLTVPPTETSVAINRLLPATSYHFRIFAENDLGRSHPSAVAVATTLEEAPSTPPSDIIVKAVSSTVLKVSWKAPSDKSQIAGYYLGYKTQDSDEQVSYKTLKAVGGEAEEYKLRSLKKNTEYSLRLQAFNKAGAGPASDHVVARTLEHDPPSSPVVQVTFVSANNARVHWSRADDVPIAGYLLQYRDEGSDWTEISVASDVSFYDLQPLRCGTHHQVRMAAFNNVGRSELSEQVNFRTEGTAPVAPEKGIFISPNVTSVLLQLSAWQAAECPVENFAVQYKASEDKEWVSLESVIPAGRKALVVTDLEPATWYNVFVTAVNAAGSTGAEFVFSTLTLSGDPVSPVRIHNHQERRLYRHLSIVVPIICAVVIVVVVIIVVCAIHTRRHPHPGRSGSNSDNGEFQSRQMQKGDSLVMTSVRKKDPLCATYESPKDSLYYPAPYATSRLSGYVIEEGGSECESFHSSQRESASQGSHTYDIPFPVKKPEQEDQYTRIKKISSPSVPCANVYQTPQLCDSTRWRTYQQRPLSEKFNFKTDCAPKQRRWSGGSYKTGTDFRKKGFQGITYRLSDEDSDATNGDDFDEGHEVSEAECDREVKFLTTGKGNYLTVVIPPEGGNFCKTTTVQ